MSINNTSTGVLNSSRDSTTSLATLFQCSISILMKNFLIISNLNPPGWNLKSFPLVLAIVIWEKNTNLNCLNFLATRREMCLIMSQSFREQLNFRKFVSLHWFYISFNVFFVVPLNEFETMSDTVSNSSEIHWYFLAKFMIQNKKFAKQPTP